MGKTLKKILCTLLVVVMCLTVAPLQGIADMLTFKASAITITSYSQGDIIEFGWYPQSKVTDSATISVLNSAGGKWVSYNYYSGSGNYSDGKMNFSNYMRYTDVMYGSNKYRGIVFDSYRPYFTGYTSSASYAYQDENGYDKHTVYWFKYEPIKWRVIDPTMGMVVSETILDSQAYNNYVLASGKDKYGYTAYWGDSSKTYYANNYRESSIRQWLNNDFYNTAFSSNQQNIINSTILDNSACNDSYSAYDSVTTKDKIYLLSWDDFANTSYGFFNCYSKLNIDNRVYGSDYAQSQGLYVYKNSESSYDGNSKWLLRSPGCDSNNCCVVDYDGSPQYAHYCSAFDTFVGIRPVFNFNLTSEIFQSDVKDTGNSSSNGTGEVNTNESYFMVSSDQYSVDSINGKENATYKIHLLDQNSSFLPIDNVTVQNNTEYIVDVSTKKISDTELELTVKPLSNGDASISLFNGDNSNPQYFNFTVYSNTTTYRADQVPVTNEKLKTNFSRGDLTVDNFEYKFDENKGKYIATMDVYNSSGAIGVVAAYTQDGKISEIEQVDPYIPLPGDFGEFLVYLGSGAVGILKGENWNYRFAGYNEKTPIEIEVPEDGYLTVSCDVLSDKAAFVSNAVSIAVDTIFKSTEIITALAKIGDTEGVAKKTKKSLLERVVDIFNDDDGWAEKIVDKFTKKIPKELSLDFFKEISNLSLDAISELFKDTDEDIYKEVIKILVEITFEEGIEYGAVKMATKAVKDKVIEAAEESLLKAASLMFKGGEYINLLNSMLGAYRYNDGTGKTMVVFKPKGEDGFICKDTIKVKSDIITDEVLLHTYVIKDTQKEDAFVRKTIYSDFNRGDGLRKEELSIDLNRIVEIHEISLWKNGQEVFDTFTATVEMNLPSYIDRRTCSIYRVEKDGTYTKLNTRIEGNKIIFETNHFSEYILTGVVEDLQETTPCDVHVYDEVRTEPSCTEPGKIVYTCYCGDTYSETLKSNGHNLSDWYVVAHPKCETTGTEQRNCSVCDYSETQEIPATGHNFDDSKCRTCGFDKSDYCGCKCHKTGFISKIIWFITNFFNKLFKKNQVCNCGKVHF